MLFRSLGFLAVLRRPADAARRGLLFAAMCLLLYLAALLYGSLTVPFYCIAKASYTLGLLPCYGAMASAGLDMLPKRPLFRATAYGLLAVWAFGVYLTYFAQ